MTLVYANTASLSAISWELLRFNSLKNILLRFIGLKGLKKKFPDLNFFFLIWLKTPFPLISLTGKSSKNSLIGGNPVIWIQISNIDFDVHTSFSLKPRKPAVPLYHNMSCVQSCSLALIWSMLALRAFTFPVYICILCKSSTTMSFILPVSFTMCT